MEQRLVAIIESIIQENTKDPTNLITLGRPDIKPFWKKMIYYLDYPLRIQLVT